LDLLDGEPDIGGVDPVFSLDWFSINSGGAEEANDDFILQGYLGNTSAGRLEGVGFVLIGGFGGVALGDPSIVFGDGFESGDTSLWSGGE
jgi:hypothetical protein